MHWNNKVKALINDRLIMVTKLSPSNSTYKQIIFSMHHKSKNFPDNSIENIAYIYINKILYVKLNLKSEILDKTDNQYNKLKLI